MTAEIIVLPVVRVERGGVAPEVSHRDPADVLPFERRAIEMARSQSRRRLTSLLSDPEPA